MRRAFILLAAGSALLLAGSIALASTLDQPGTLQFSIAQGSSSVNTTVIGAGASEQVALGTVSYSTGTGDGTWYRATRSSRGSGQSWVDLKKDDGTSPPWNGADTCLDDAISQGYSAGTNDFHADLFMATSGFEYRVGPYTPGANLGQATLASGTALPVPAQSSTLRFLTGANYTATATNGVYHVAWIYGNASLDTTVDVQVAPTGTASRNLSGIGWTTTSAGAVTAETGASCAPARLDEVVVQNPHPAATSLLQVTITYTADGTGEQWLRGPVAVALEITAADYTSLFDDQASTFYSGHYDTASGALRPSGGTNLIWYGVSWNETVTDASSVPLGDLQLGVFCNGTLTGPVSGIFSTTLYGNDSTVTNPLDKNPANPSSAVPGLYYCDSPEISYTASMTAYFDTTPTLDGITFYYTADADADGYGLTSVATPNGTLPPDCNDADATVNPGATEILDGKDDNCNGQIDEGTAGFDDDGDCYCEGYDYGSGSPTCQGSVNGSCATVLPGDCDDTNPAVHPGAVDVPGDDLDQNCDGTVACYIDADNDGFGASTSAESTYPATGGIANSPGACGASLTDGFDDTGDDCDDTNASMHPGATDVPGDDLDQNCDGTVACYVDADHDGYGSTTSAESTFVATGGVANILGACGSSTSDGWDDDSLDCDDTVATTNPGARDVCGNGVDDDCNPNGPIWSGLGPSDTIFPGSSNADEDGDGLSDVVEATTLTDICNPDTDGDGLGDAVEDPRGLAPTDPSFGTSGLHESDPTQADTDGDGLCDGNVDVPVAGCIGGEALTGTDPMRADTDGDGLTDGQEDPAGDGTGYGVTKTNPLDYDTDQDGIKDGSETFPLSALKADTDGDGLKDGVEDDRLVTIVASSITPNGYAVTGNSGVVRDADPTTHTDPTAADTDGDGLCDGSNSVPSSPTHCIAGEDMNDDGQLAGGGGACTETSPLDADSDEDGLSDGAERGYGTNPLMWDTDGDGLSDGQEMGIGFASAPAAGGSAYPYTGTEMSSLAGSLCGARLFVPDANGQHDTDPLDVDTDNDALCDGLATPPPAGCIGAEDRNDDGAVSAGETNPADADTDDDGLADGMEDVNGDGVRGVLETDPKLADTDGDGLDDGLEKGVTAAAGIAAGTSDGSPGVRVAYQGTSAGWSADTDPSTTTDPLDADTDNDGLCDGPLAVAGQCAAGEDLNANGVVDANETDPADADTDDDAIADGEERAGVAGYGPTDPTKADTDGDGLADGLEVGRTTGVAAGTSASGVAYQGTSAGWSPDIDPSTTTDPANPDTDADGLCDGPVTVLGLCAGGEDQNANGAVDVGGETDPLDADTDGDTLSDGEERIAVCDAGYTLDPAHCANPLSPDTDGDGVDDATEALAACDPDAASARSGTSTGAFPTRAIVPADCDDSTGGSIDVLDTDDDGDGVPTVCEDWVDDAGNRLTGASATNPGCASGAHGDGNKLNDDRDGDTVPNYLDVDDDGDTLTTAAELVPATGCVPVTVSGDPALFDLDGDGWPDYLDPDDDGDTDPAYRTAKGVAASSPDYTAPTRDEIAAGTDHCAPDSDGDGVIDGTELGADPTAPRDTDGDGTIDALDPDDDDDGIPTAAEDDGTGLANADAVAFDDGVMQCAADAIPNYLDSDSDNDGVCDGIATAALPGQMPCLPGQTTDRDGSGLFILETPSGDHDSDSVPNIWDCDDLSSGCSTADTDRDGIDTCTETGVCMTAACPSGVRGVTTGGVCCLNPNDVDTDADCVNDGDETNLGAALVDTDDDGVPDAFDTDDDGDGVPTNMEYYDLDANGQFQFDPTDGHLLRLDPTTCNPTIDDASYVGPSAMDTDGDGIPDYKDTDDDGDGIPTSIEGTGDADHDGLPNYLDTDSDGDGISDHDEGGASYQQNGTLPDTDGDGIPDYLDPASAKPPPNPKPTATGCGCDATGGGGLPSLVALLLGIAILLPRRRRRVSPGRARPGA